MKCSILLVCGSLRARSVNLAVLKVAAEMAGPGIATQLYQGMSNLPHYDPDDDREPLHSCVAGLRTAIGRAEALLFCTPEYAGGLPGSFKNLLDWTVGGTEMNNKPVAWINTASPAAPTGGRDAHTSLRKVLGYVAACIVEPACIQVPLSRADVEVDGTIRSVSIRSQIAASLSLLANSAQLESSSPSQDCNWSSETDQNSA